jgi:hypothetical protein
MINNKINSTLNEEQICIISDVVKQNAKQDDISLKIDIALV